LCFRLTCIGQLYFNLFYYFKINSRPDTGFVYTYFYKKVLDADWH
jgi:hypothetical protein